jgi:hypothetical protein
MIVIEASEAVLNSVDARISLKDQDMASFGVRQGRATLCLGINIKVDMTILPDC